MALAVRVHQSIRTWNPLPVKRVYVPKANAKLRPLGIPVIMDRCHQNRAKNALEPEWEARFEARSYGFRPGRSCQDAIEAIYDTCKGRTAARIWALDADLAAAFDRLDHSHLMPAIGSFPGREMIRDWVTAGVFEPGKGFAPTGEGSPQGGVISPVLLNVALHGLEEAAGVRYGPDGARTATGSPVLVRYCDDFVVCCHTRQQAEQVKARLARWLAPRGLAFNDEKTKIVSLEAGFDFLGFSIRRYRNGKLLIKPSNAAVRRVKHKLAGQMRRLRGQTHPPSSPRSAPSPAAGRATTGRWCPRRHSPAWTTTCGSSPASGPAAATPASRGPGSSNGTSASSTPPGATCGYSATPPAAPTSPTSPGHPSSGTARSPAGRPPTTRPWPATGTSGAAGTSHRSTAALCACSRCSTAAARSARTCSCTPTGSLTLPGNGNSGTAPSAKRSPGSSSPHAGRACRMAPVSYTPTASAGQPAQAVRNRHLHAPEPPKGLA